MLTRLGTHARRWAASTNPWTNVYGLARTILAMGTMGTLIFSHPQTLFRPGTGVPEAPVCEGLSNIALFCFLPENLEVTRWIAVLILLVVASGWHPRITGVLHWWISFSLFTSAILVDGGDQMTTVLTLLLIPITLTDGRRWHWQPVEQAPPATGGEEYRRLIALSTFVAIRVQVAGIYFQAVLAKFEVPQWANGTALYYWLTDPAFGTPDWLTPFVLPLLTNGVTVVLMTWSVLLLETLLFTGLVMDRRGWPYLLKAGIVFHLGIAVFQGLVSFFFATTAALILFLRPKEEPFKVPRVVQHYVVAPLRRWFTRLTNPPPEDSISPRPDNPVSVES